MKLDSVVTFSHMTPHKKNREKKESSRRIIQKCANLKNEIRVRQILRIGHFRKACNKNDASAEKQGTWRKVSISSK